MMHIKHCAMMRIVGFSKAGQWCCQTIPPLQALSCWRALAPSRAGRSRPLQHTPPQTTHATPHRPHHTQTSHCRLHLRSWMAFGNGNPLSPCASDTGPLLWSLPSSCECVGSCLSKFSMYSVGFLDQCFRGWLKWERWELFGTFRYGTVWQVPFAKRPGVFGRRRVLWIESMIGIGFGLRKPLGIWGGGWNSRPLCLN